MQRELKAAFLLSSLVVAAADRSLLAGKPAGGALHGVAITPGNYFITNGNGTWTNSYYSSSTPNGNNAGQNGATYATTNTAYAAATAFTGVKAVANSGITGGSGIALAGTTPGTGLTAVTFPSKNLGVAVGVANAVAVANGGTAGAVPTILITVDGALSWLAVTGVPTTALTGPSQFSQGAGLQNGAPNPTLTVPGGSGAQFSIVGGAMTAPSGSLYPAISGGDLTNVYMASKTTGWAVGGNSVALAAGGAGSLPLGMVLMTTNGGTVWKNVPIFYSRAQFLAVSGIPSSLSALQNANPKMPGILFGIGADAAGKNVYAVGSPSASLTPVTYPGGVDGANAAIAAFTTTLYATGTVPTILYSGNSGSTWAFQTAPVSPVNQPYTLTAIAVQKGTTAVAVGGGQVLGPVATTGCPTNSISFAQYTSSMGCNGQILLTTNGGFSWTQTGFPDNNGAKAPTFTTVAIQTTNVYWVGGVVRSDIHWPVAPETGFTNVGAAFQTPGTPTANGKVKSDGAAYNVLYSTNGGQTFSPVPVSVFPPGFVMTGQVAGPVQNVAPSTTAVCGSASNPCNDVFGIVWDNDVRGYIYGNGYILGTTNAGKSWVFEQALSGTAFISLSNVPTSY